MSLIVYKAPFNIKLYELEMQNFYLSTIGIFIKVFLALEEANRFLYWL